MSLVHPSNGWHLGEWRAEFLGTAVLLFAVVTTKELVLHVGPPASDQLGMLSIIGLVAGAVVACWAFTPLGRRSGSHLNPAVTFGLWCQKVVAPADLAGYVIAQAAGGTLGVVAARIWGADVAGPQVDWAVIRPATWLSQPAAAMVEAVATSAQLAVVFALLTSRRWHRWTPVVGGALLTAAIVTLAPVSGAGFNPVRGLAPDVVAGAFPAGWIYLVGPLAGAALAAGALIATGRRAVTGKLRHDPRVPCHMRCALTHEPATELFMRQEQVQLNVR